MFKLKNTPPVPHVYVLVEKKQAEREKQFAIDSAAFVKTLKPSKWLR